MIAAGGVAAQETPGDPGDPNRYALQPGDKVGFDILTDSDPASVLTIGADGRVLAPLLGDFAVAGMRVAEARDALAASYVAAGLLTSPRIGMTLAAFRDLYVTGDVANPGMFPFQLQMTVEQALALAGGLLTSGGTVDGVLLQRAKLEADLTGNTSAIAREAVWIARLRAQIGGKPAIDLADLPAEAKAVIDVAMVDALLPVEQQFLEEQATALAKLRESNDFEIAQSESELVLLQERLGKQTASIEFSRKEVERARTLVERGLRAASDISATERQLISEEGIYLGILAQIAQARTRISALKSASVQTDSAARLEALQLLQERDAELRRRLAVQSGLSNQRFLLTSSAADAPVTAIRFQLRRRGPAGSQLLDAVAMTPVMPGDVLIVSLQPIQPAE